MRYLYIFIIFILYSCSKNIGETKIISFDVQNEIKDIEESNVISDYRIVKLNSDDSCGMIGNIDKILLFDDKIYIADLTNTLTVYVYNINGNFINKINRHGQSNSEYIQLSSIFIDSDDKTFNLLSRYPSKILSFDIDGKEIQSIKNINTKMKTYFEGKNEYNDFTQV